MRQPIVVTFFLFLTGSLAACGGRFKNHIHQEIVVMDTKKLTHTSVRAAIQAWQQGDSILWLSFFTDKAKLLDDGHPRDFHKFSTEAIGHERFTSIDKVEDNGLSVYGKFHSDTWGDFKTYFRFHLDSSRKFYQLDIGQADY